MTRDHEIKHIASEIKQLLKTLESVFFDAFVASSYHDNETEEIKPYLEFIERDNKTWLYHGTRELYLKICVFLEMKNLPLYHKMFVKKFSEKIDNEEHTLDSYPGLYNESDPSMVIHDEIREFLSVFYEFDNENFKKLEINKLKLILENTVSLISKTKTKVTNEASIYRPIKWFVEIIFPTMRSLGRARFIEKFSTYHPDILIPEISSCVEYKYVRKGLNPETFLTQIKTDADNYVGDPIYRFFYAVVVYEDKSELNPEAFKNAVLEKKFPKNWTILAV